MGRTLLDGLDVLGSEQPRPAVLDAHVEVPGEPCHTGFVEAELIGHLPGGLEVGLPHAGQDTGWGLRIYQEKGGLSLVFPLKHTR